LGIFRRHIRLSAEGNSVAGALEDDFHCVSVRLEHDGTTVTACSGETQRIPWTTCPGAAAELERFRGMRLDHSLLASARHSDPRLHCTHLFDVASLLVTHAAAGRGQRLYRIAIPERRDGRTTATLIRDGEEVLCWLLHNEAIEDPVPFAGRTLVGGGFARWAETEFDLELAEAAIVLRRACLISLGRGFPLDQIPFASDLGERTAGTCYSFAPERSSDGRRIVGSTLDFSDREDQLLAAPALDPTRSSR